MYLTKDEIIEINSGKKYLILGCTKILEKEYYKICKIGEKLDELIGNCKYITVSKENEHLIIEEILEEPLLKELEGKISSSLWAFFSAKTLSRLV